MGDRDTSLAVSADAQFGKVQVLLPFADFEDIYQGQAGNIPIAFPGGLDRNAGKAGFDANLALGHPVPRGSRISIGIPICENPGAGITEYKYYFIFRDRTLTDHKTTGLAGNRVPYHYAKEGLGAEDSTLVVTARRFPIDARYMSIGYEQSEPVDAGGVGVLHLYPEAVIPRDFIIPNPLLPSGNTAAIQQGIYDPQDIPDAKRVIRKEYQIDCLGDDLIILATKVPDDEGDYDNWDFSGANPDVAFANTYGRGGANPTHEIFVDGGIRVTTGTNP